MNVLLRVLGIELLSRAAKRLPGASAWWAGLAVLVVVNLLPIAAVLAGQAGIGDVFLVYWWENVMVWVTGIVRIATAEGPGLTDSSSRRTKVAAVRGGSLGDAAFFAVHYGAFTLMHGLFTAIIVAFTGIKGGVVPLVLLGAAITVSQLVQLGLVWFGYGERKVVSPLRAMFLPYPRMIVMQIAVILGFFFVLGGPSGDGPVGSGNQTAGVVVLCVLKLLLDVAFHLASRPKVAPPGDAALYGAAA